MVCFTNESLLMKSSLSKSPQLKPILLSLSLLLIATAGWSQKKQYNNLQEALYSASQLRGEGGPSNLVWINDGEQYSFSKRNEGNQEIWIHDMKSGDERRIFTTKDVTFPGSDDPFGYDSYQWAGEDNYLLFRCNFTPVWRYSGNADYYYYSLEAGTMEKIVEQAFTAEVSPDGTKVGFGKDGNLFAYLFETRETIQYTNDAEPHFYNGRFGWAYEEEFGLVQAWSWSHDSRYIAFWQSDEREVPIYKLTDFQETHPSYLEVPYPKVGDPVPQVKIGVIDTESGERSWVDFDPRGGYIPRIYWTSEPGQLALVYMNRPQNHLEVHFTDVTDGSMRLVYEESSDSWIDIFDFFAGELHHFTFPGDMDSFFFISEKDGWAHIYRINYTGELIQQVTSGAFEVIGIKAIDPDKEKIYYLSTEVSPLERNLYEIRFNGKRKRRLTDEEGNHSVDVAPRGEYFLDRFSSVENPVTVTLKNSRGRVLEVITENNKVDTFLEEHVYAPKELFTFTTEEGHQLDGYIIRPVNFDPDQQYPPLLDIYGGPGSQGVYNAFGTNGWHQWMAQEGYVIASVNNRGNGGYGSAFEKAVYGQLGKLEAADFAETARYLAKMPWIDGDRMAIRGHSYGGFMSSYTMLNYPGLFQVSLVAAPNCDHRLYDCILTERLMGLLEDNREGYENSAVANYAGNLEGNMLLVHSLMDENVHPQHTFQLVKAFIDQGKDVDLRIYPPGNHGVAYSMSSYMLLMKQYTEYLDRHLRE